METSIHLGLTHSRNYLPIESPFSLSLSLLSLYCETSNDQVYFRYLIKEFPISLFLMAFQCDNDWQSTKKTVLERNSHMFNNALMSDIKFTCAESKRKCFYAHKYVLATSSVVFYTMFYGGLTEKGPTIHLPDTDEESLEVFLRFLYTEDCKMTAEDALNVMYLSKKYIVPSLTEKCVEVFHESLQPDNVVTVLEQAMHFDEKELEKKCLEVVESQAGKVVSSEAFCHISQGTLINILKLDKLSGIKEIELFHAVLKWSSAQCAKSGLEATGEKRRAVIGDALYQIRFPTMSQEEFAQYVSRSGLLTAEEVSSIYDKSPYLKWRQPKRNQPILKGFKRCNLLDIRAPDTSGWHYIGNPESLGFRVNKAATFHGVYLFGDDKGSKYEVTLEVNRVKVTDTYTSECNSECVYGFCVMLPRPISVKENQLVIMDATIRGPNSYYIGKFGGVKSVEVDGVKVIFNNVSGSPSNGTNIFGGQFYEIILSSAG